MITVVRLHVLVQNRHKRIMVTVTPNSFPKGMLKNMWYGTACPVQMDIYRGYNRSLQEEVGWQVVHEFAMMEEGPYYVAVYWARNDEPNYKWGRVTKSHRYRGKLAWSDTL